MSESAENPSGRNRARLVALSVTAMLIVGVVGYVLMPRSRHDAVTAAPNTAAELESTTTGLPGSTTSTTTTTTTVAASAVETTPVATTAAAATTVKKVTKTTTKPTLPPTQPTIAPPGSYGIVDGISPAEWAARDAMITYVETDQRTRTNYTKHVTSSAGEGIQLLYNNSIVPTGNGFFVSWHFDVDPNCRVFMLAY